MTGPQETAFDRLCHAIQEHTGQWPRGHGRQRSAICPAHDDTNPSLSVTDGNDRVLLKCQAGCDTDDILTELGLTRADLFNEPKQPGQHPRVVAEYRYRDENGTLLYTIKRFEPGFDGESKTFRPYLPGARKSGLGRVRRVLYRLPELLAAIAGGVTVYVVEGEKDVDRLAACGAAATCNLGGATKPGDDRWRPDYTKVFAGATVVIIADRDGPGRVHARNVRDHLTGVADQVRVVQAAVDREHADVSDHLAAGHGLDDLVPVDLTSPDPADTTPGTAEGGPAGGPVDDARGQIVEELGVHDDHMTDARILRGLYPDQQAALRHFTEPADDFGGTTAPLPAFDIDTMLPAAVRAFVRNITDHLQVPPEAVALMAISTLATAAAGRVHIDGRGGWRQPAYVWTTTTMHSGERKSDVVRLVTEPIRRTERHLIAQHRDTARSHAQDKTDLTAYLKDLKAELAKTKKAGDRQRLEQRIEDATGRLDDMTEPGPPPALLVEDATVEALSQRLEENHQRLGALSDEGGIFQLIAGRYTGGLPNLDLYLKAYDESPVRVDRVNRGTVYLPHPALAIGLLVQPDVLDKAARIPGARERGLLGRFLFALPESTLGHRDPDSPAPDPHIADDWHRIVTTILAIPPLPDEQPHILAITDLAHKLLRELRVHLEPHLEPVIGRYAHMSDWAGKLAGKVLRLAALYHLTEHPLTQPVGEATMTEAIGFGLWALRHAERVHAEWKASAADQHPGVAWLHQWLAKRPRDTFTFRDAQQTAKRSAWYTSARDLEQALCILVRARLLSSCVRSTGTGRPEPKGLFIVRPEAPDDDR